MSECAPCSRLGMYLSLRPVSIEAVARQVSSGDIFSRKTLHGSSVSIEHV